MRKLLFIHATGVSFRSHSAFEQRPLHELSAMQESTHAICASKKCHFFAERNVVSSQRKMLFPCSEECRFFAVRNPNFSQRGMPIPHREEGRFLSSSLQRDMPSPCSEEWLFNAAKNAGKGIAILKPLEFMTRQIQTSRCNRTAQSWLALTSFLSSDVLSSFILIFIPDIALRLVVCRQGLKRHVLKTRALTSRAAGRDWKHHAEGDGINITCGRRRFSR